MNKSMMMTKNDIINIAIKEGIGVNLKGYPSLKMAEELDRLFNSAEGFSSEIKGSTIHLEKDNYFLTRATVLDNGITFSNNTSEKAVEAVKMMVKYLVEQTFN